VSAVTDDVADDLLAVIAVPGELRPSTIPPLA
jgi:hypothetical protein